MYSERPEGLKYLLGLSFEDRGLVSEVGWWLVGSWRMEVDCAPIKEDLHDPGRPSTFACLPAAGHPRQARSGPVPCGRWAAGRAPRVMRRDRGCSQRCGGESEGENKGEEGCQGGGAGMTMRVCAHRAPKD